MENEALETNKEMALALKFPVKIGTAEKVSVLNFRRVKGKDLRKFNMANPTMEDLLNLAERLTQQTTSFFDEMDGQDVVKVVEKVGELLDGSQETGK